MNLSSGQILLIYTYFYRLGEKIISPSSNYYVYTIDFTKTACSICTYLCLKSQPSGYTTTALDLVKNKFDKVPIDNCISLILPSSKPGDSQPSGYTTTVLDLVKNNSPKSQLVIVYHWFDQVQNQGLISDQKKILKFFPKPIYQTRLVENWKSKIFCEFQEHIPSPNRGVNFWGSIYAYGGLNKAFNRGSKLALKKDNKIAALFWNKMPRVSYGPTYKMPSWKLQKTQSLIFYRNSHQL